MMTTLKELLAMDEKEITDGYRAAGRGYRLTGAETPAFIHGWNNGQCDFNGAPITDEMVNLAKEYAAHMKGTWLK